MLIDALKLLYYLNLQLNNIVKKAILEARLLKEDGTSMSTSLRTKYMTFNQLMRSSNNNTNNIFTFSC